MNRWAIATSAALHASLLGGALVGARHGHGIVPAPGPSPVIDMILNDPGAETRDDGSKAAQDIPRDEAAPTPPDTRPTSTDPADPAFPAVRVAAALPQVRLGEDEPRGRTDHIEGADLAPPALDGSRRNIPPRYPRDAAERGEHGRVAMLVHVTASGTVDEVEIAESSGSPRLDRAAQDAVLRWHFTPATRDGVPTGSIVPHVFNFILGAQEAH